MCSAWFAHSSSGDLRHLPYFLARLAMGMVYFIPVVIALATISPSSGHLSLPSGFRTKCQHSFLASTTTDATAAPGPVLTWLDPWGLRFPPVSSQSVRLHNLQVIKIYYTMGKDFHQWVTKQRKACIDKWLPFLSPWWIVFRCCGSIWLLGKCSLINPIEYS